MKNIVFNILITIFCLTGTSYAKYSKSRFHWVGVFNIKYDSTIQRRANTNQILSAAVFAQKGGMRLHLEIGEPTFSGSSDRHLPLAGIERNAGNSSKSTSIEPFLLQAGEIKFDLGDYYFVGSAKTVDSPIKGKIYEKSSNLLAGYFDLYPRHDGSDSYTYVAPKSDARCFDQAGNFPKECFGPGAP